MAANLTKRYSPFSKEFWIEKGFSEEKAEYKRNSIRPIKKEYWLERGYSEEESIELAKNKKDSNNKAGGRKSASRPIEELRKGSQRCIEYYIERGSTEEEAHKLRKDYQATFTLEKCVKKHGLMKGKEIFDDRQRRWNESLYNKTPEEIERFHNSKRSFPLSKYTSIDECIKDLKIKRNMNLFSDVNSYKEYLTELFYNSRYLQYQTVEYFCSKISIIQKEIFDNLQIDYMEILRPLFKGNIIHLIKDGKQAYRLRTEFGLLRSSYEIYFYELLRNVFDLNTIDFELDKKYPNSQMRFDFRIGNDYIEICPLYGIDDKYTIKMNKKRELFGCILLKDADQMSEYVGTLCENINKKLN